MFKRVVGKFKGQRSDKKWSVYATTSKDLFWTIQTDNKIAMVYKDKSRAIVSKTRSGACFVDLSYMRGANCTEVPAELFNQLEELGNDKTKLVRLV